MNKTEKDHRKQTQEGMEVVWCPSGWLAEEWTLEV